MARPTVQDLARHARIPDLDAALNNEDLERFLGAAIEHVESQCGPLDPTSTVTLWSDGGTILLPFYGVESVTVVDATDLPVEVHPGSNLLAGSVRLAYPYAGTYTFSVTRARPAVDALWLATLLIAAYLWDARRGATSNNRPQVGDELEPDRIPPRARTLMAPWMMPGIA